jgi:hypothetical protein
VRKLKRGRLHDPTSFSLNPVPKMSARSALTTSSRATSRRDSDADRPDAERVAEAELEATLRDLCRLRGAGGVPKCPETPRSAAGNTLA